jgi:hypothetical protein
MYIDLDIRKSFPRMLQHICQNNGLNPVNLGNYITMGDQVVQQILNEQQQGNLRNTQGRALPPLLGEDVKKAFLVSLHCGSYRNSVTQGCRVDILDEFATEIRQVAMKLYELPSYSSVRAHVEAQKGEDENRLGSFISLICQDQESKVIEALRECLGEQGFVVRVNMYDGLLVDKENAPRLCDEECLESLGDAVFETTGCRVQFVQKPIEKYTLEEVCIPTIATAAITPADKVVLFGLEETLITRGVVRPGAADALALLLLSGNVKIGLFTDEPKRRVDLEGLQKQLNVKFDVVLTGEHCYPTGGWTEATQNTKHKSLSHHFPNNHNVVLIDSKPELVVEKDRRNTWTWEEEEKRGWTCRVPHHRDGLQLSTYTTVERVVAKTVHMLDDPVMNPDTVAGKANLGKWNRTAVLTGPQGAGKSFAALEIIRVSLQPSSCCLLLVPSRALAKQLAKDLRDHLQRRNDERSVLLYLEENAREASNSNINCDFLVVGPLSLKFHLPQLYGRTLGVVVIDEVPELRQMLATFLEAGARALEESLLGVAYVLDMAQKVMLISAQMQDKDIQWATDMMTTETRGKQEILIFDSDYIPRQTVTWKVKNGAHLRSLIGGYIDEEKSVVCFAETVEMADNLKEWFDIKYKGQPQKPEKRARSFTAKVCSRLQKGTKSVSDYGKDCDLFVYTSALGLGMNLTPTFDVRFMITNAGFTSAKRLAQLAGRPRNCIQADLYICLGQSRWRKRPGDGLEEMARNKVISEYQESLVPKVVNGKLERTLPENGTTLARLEIAKAEVLEGDPAKRLDMFHYWSDSSRHGGNAPGYHLEYPIDEHWEQLEKACKLRQTWKDNAVFLTKDELHGLMKEMHKRKATSDGMAMTIINFDATASIMPYMVGNGPSTGSGGQVLTNDLLFDLYKKDTYIKLDNFLEMMSCTESEGVYHSTAADILFPLWSKGQITCLSGSSTRVFAAAILVACGPTLDVHLGVKGGKAGAQRADKLFALQTVTSDQQAKARVWIAKHWEKNNINRKGEWATVMPQFGTDGWWKFVGGFMRDTYGFGVEKTKLGHRLVANGFWKAHRIDVLQLGLSHRSRTQQQVNGAAIIYNDRPYGVLEQQMRKCFRCATSRPPTMCVRQKGTEWVCMSPEPSDGVVGTCHRDFYTAIDTGYLDVEIPNDERKDAMVIAEIQDEALEEQESKEAEQRERIKQVQNNLARLPVAHRQLLRDLGFIPGTYEVTANQMQAAWISATDTDYLESIQLSHMTSNGEHMRSVRKLAHKLLANSHLQIVNRGGRVAGKRVNTFAVTTV